MEGGCVWGVRELDVQRLWKVEALSFLCQHGSTEKRKWGGAAKGNGYVCGLRKDRRISLRFMYTPIFTVSYRWVRIVRER